LIDYVSFDRSISPRLGDVLLALIITIFGIIAVLLDVGIVNIFLFFMLFEFASIPISTLSHSGIAYVFGQEGHRTPPRSKGARTPMSVGVTLKLLRGFQTQNFNRELIYIVYLRYSNEQERENVI